MLLRQSQKPKVEHPVHRDSAKPIAPMAGRKHGTKTNPEPSSANQAENRSQNGLFAGAFWENEVHPYHRHILHGAGFYTKTGLWANPALSSIQAFGLVLGWGSHANSIFFDSFKSALGPPGSQLPAHSLFHEGMAPVDLIATTSRRELPKK